MEIEIWKDIVGYEGYYQVSNLGRVKSVKRIIRRPYGRGGDMKIINQTIEERIRKPGDGDGHLYVPLCKDGKSKNWSVHELVLNAFVCPRPLGMEGCHEDGNYKNNHVGNLRWDTHKGNHQDRIRHGTNNRGEKNGSAKITGDQVIEIRKMYATGLYLLRDIATIFGITENSIRCVVRGHNWKHVEFLPESNFGRGYVRLKKLEETKKNMVDGS